MKKHTVLIIEDHESLRRLTGRFLSKKFNAITKADALSGLAWMQSGNIPDLILLDMSMPRLSGIDFLSNIRSSGIFSSIPVIVVSNEEDEQLIKQCEDLSIVKYVIKPFNPIELADLIESTLHKSEKQLINTIHN